MPQPDPTKLDKLRAALEQFEEGDGQLFDHDAEEAKAKVRKRALGLLDQRSRSRHELRQRLVQAEFAPEVIDEVIEDLSRAHLVDDATFAHEWVRQRHARRGKSARVLDQELQRKGVAEEDRRAALEQIDEADEKATARELARKKARSIKAVPADRQERDKALRRIVGVLARRGFPEGMSLALAKQALEERCAEL